MAFSLMKRVLIVAYFYPPCGLTGAHRAHSWVKGFPDSGIFPVVVSRKWDVPIKTLADMGIPTSEGVSSEINDQSEVYRVPYKATFKDRIYNRFGNSRLVLFRRMLSLLELFAQNLNIRWSIYEALYDEARVQCLKGNIDAIVVTGMPFTTFQIGYLLHREFNIPWVADYRDPWTTSEIDAVGRSPLFSVVNAYDRYFEKKWVGTASTTVSVSMPLAKQIGMLTNTPFDVIENGFKDDLFDAVPDSGKFEQFTVTYIGTLYFGQNIELFLEAAWRFVEQRSLSPAEFRILFPGLGFDVQQSQRIREFNTQLTDYIEITDRMPQQEILLIEKRSDILLFVAWKGFEGIMGSKTYEYCGSGTPILIAPGDDGEVNRMMNETGAGRICDTVEDTVAFLDECYEAKKTGKDAPLQRNEQAIEKLKRSYQTRKLAGLLLQAIDNS